MKNLKSNLTELVFMEFIVIIGLLFTEIEKQLIVTIIGLVFIGFMAGKLYSAVNGKKEKDERKKENKKRYYYKKK